MLRKHVDIPTTAARLLKAAGVENQPPEIGMGLLFGALAQLCVAVSDQWPAAWPVFRRAAIEAAEQLLAVLRADSPKTQLASVLAMQRDMKETNPSTLEQVPEIH